MLSYCSKCRRNTESKNRRVEKTKTRRIMLSQVVRTAAVKIQNLLKNIKLADY